VPRRTAIRRCLIVAGAGTGKTNTLAHRVAHLIVRRADPRRIMLLTFSRRAALEMTRRVERIAAHVAPGQARLVADALTWSGTFHAIGARLLREYAEQIGVDRAFTIHDREDSADLINLVRHELGFSKTQQRFPAKATCLAIYSLRGQATAECARLRRPAALLGPVAETVKRIRSSAAGWPEEFELACRWYAPHLERRYEDARIRQADLEQLAQIASTYPNRHSASTPVVSSGRVASKRATGLPHILQVGKLDAFRLRLTSTDETSLCAAPLVRISTPGWSGRGGR
jgi:UvrD/REP helicase N-terminal domain